MHPIFLQIQTHLHKKCQYVNLNGCKSFMLYPDQNGKRDFYSALKIPTKCLLLYLYGKHHTFYFYTHLLFLILNVSKKKLEAKKYYFLGISLNIKAKLNFQMHN